MTATDAINPAVLAPPLPSRWRRLRWAARLLTITILMLAAYLTLPLSTDWLAGIVFGNAIPAADKEMAATPVFPRWSIDEWASVPGRGEGLNCSIPPSALAAFANKHGSIEQSSINLRFRQACVAHDLCYRHGRAAYGYTQAQCDANLVDASFRICKRLHPNPADVEWCANQARKVLAGVTFGGFSSYRPAMDDGTQLGKAADSFQHASVPAEYDPFPTGSAVYAFPRLIHGPCLGLADVPILISYLRRPGGASASVRCFDGKVFQIVNAKGLASYKSDRNISSEYSRRLGPPWLVDMGPVSSLLQWCRIYRPNNSTGGFFYLQRHQLTFEGCPDNLDGRDPDMVTPFPVPGVLSERVPAVGLTGHRLKIFDPPVAKEKLSQSSARCTGGQCEIDLLATCDRTTSLDSYRWLATTPVVLEERRQVGGGTVPAARVTLFARGCGAESDYQSLVSFSASFTADGFDHAPGVKPAFDTAQFWDIPETAEPLIPVERAGRLTGLISIQAVALDETGLHIRVIQWLNITAFITLIVAVLMLLGFSRRDLFVAIPLGVIGLASLTVAHFLGNGLPKDGFTQDAQIVFYRPGNTLEHAKAEQNKIKPFPIAGGRPWLQQRLSVLRDSNVYEIVMYRFKPSAPGHGMTLDIRVARITEAGERMQDTEGTVTLPTWATPSIFSKLVVVPFRDQTRRLNLLIMDPDDVDKKQAVVGSSVGPGFGQLDWHLLS